MIMNSSQLSRESSHDPDRARPRVDQQPVRDVDVMEVRRRHRQLRQVQRTNVGRKSIPNRPDDVRVTRRHRLMQRFDPGLQSEELEQVPQRRPADSRRDVEQRRRALRPPLELQRDGTGSIRIFAASAPAIKSPNFATSPAKIADAIAPTSTNFLPARNSFQRSRKRSNADPGFPTAESKRPKTQFDQTKESPAFLSRVSGSSVISSINSRQLSRLPATLMTSRATRFASPKKGSEMNIREPTPSTNVDRSRGNFRRSWQGRHPQLRPLGQPNQPSPACVQVFHDGSEGRGDVRAGRGVGSGSGAHSTEEGLLLCPADRRDRREIDHSGGSRRLTRLR